MEVRKMRKKIRNSIILAVFLLLGFNYSVLAEEIDTTQEGSITLNYQYDEKVISDTAVSVYKVAEVDAQGQYNYVGSFQNQTETLNGISASKLAILARNLEKVIADQKIEYTYQGKTDSIGYFKLEKLTPGAYLILTEDEVEDNKRYSAAPFFVSLPQYSNNKYEYEAVVSVKVELTELEPTPTPTQKPTPTPTPIPTPTPTHDNNTTNSPSTYDAIVVYVSILAISIIGIGIVVYYIYKKKKGSKENEE